MAKHRLFGWLTANKRIKLAALALAIVTWAAIRQAINLAIDIDDVPVSILYDAGWAVLERSTDTVDIRFQGSQEDIRYLRKENVKVIVDLRGKSARQGEITVGFRPRDIKAPGGARPISIRPAYITVRLDREGEKRVPVKIDLSGVPPSGYEVGETACNPAAVLVRGPLKRLGEIDEVRTAPIQLDDRTRSFKLRIALESPATDWDAALDPEKVMVSVKMIERSATRTLKKQPVEVLLDPNTAQVLQVQPPEVTVVLQGRRESMDALEPKAVKVFVDCSGLQPGARYELPVQVYTPADHVAVEKIKPETVSVRLEGL